MEDSLEVLLFGHPTLRERARPVEVFDAKLRRLVESMEAAMFREDGIGLAAPQVGVLERVLIAAPRGRRGGAVHHFVNPELIELSRERDSFEEGCLSLPGISADITRPVRARIRYFDLLGNEHELNDDGLLARIVQHEYDHLEGTLFVDHLSLIKRRMLAKKLRELQKRALPA
jgi:peptide deformylase